jgi:hypothetical protein
MRSYSHDVVIQFIRSQPIDCLPDLAYLPLYLSPRQNVVVIGVPHHTVSDHAYFSLNAARLLSSPNNVMST